MKGTFEQRAASLDDGRGDVGEGAADPVVGGALAGDDAVRRAAHPILNLPPLRLAELALVTPAELAERHHGHRDARPAEHLRVAGARLEGQRERYTKRMLISTTSVIDGRKVSQYLGLVTGEAILGANVFRDMFAAVRDIVGGRSAAYEQELRKAKQIAVEEMVAEATALGANGVIGVDLDYETVGQGGSMLMVSASGTAVVLQ